MIGVLVGCNKSQEWLLSWWWEHYSRHNQFPVAFADFGMTQEARSWCAERGSCYTVPAVTLHAVPPDKKALWEARAGDGIWPMRPAWFQKPLAFIRSPFPITCWIDLDCEIRSSLEPLFNLFSFGYEIGLVAEPAHVQENDRRQNIVSPGEINFNSGVVAYRTDAPLIQRWASAAIEENHHFMGDQNLLSRLIYEMKPQLLQLDPIFNWKADLGENEQALILHYVQSQKLKILARLYPELAHLTTPIL